MIAFRPDSADLNFVIAHELGHYALRVAKVPLEEGEEDRANRIAAALLAPRAALEEALAQHGQGFAPVAVYFGMTQSSVALRTGCARDESAAVVAPTHTIIVDPGTVMPSDEAAVRRLARAKTLPPGLRRARLSGAYDRGRVALLTG